MTEASPVIVWFRNDLRLRDHPALAAAASCGRPIIALYVLDDAAAGAWARGAASRWWLHHSLSRLQEQLRAVGGCLVLRRGDTAAIIDDVVRQVEAKAVYCSRAFEPWAAALEGNVRADLAKQDVAVKRFAGALLHDPDQLLTKSGGPYKVYTPFWRALSQHTIREPVAVPDAFDWFGCDLASDAIEDWGLLPTEPDWAEGLRAAWTPGEAGATEGLCGFLDGKIDGYAGQRDLPGVAGTSRLSPHLHFGEISPAQVWQAVRLVKERRDIGGDGPTVFAKEIAWREFSYHLLHHFPELPVTAFRSEFNAFPWAGEARQLKAWQRGETGYPIVDAGMRELWTTGWMHNRVRMIVASFLIKHLMVPWQDGEAWFWDCLVDADLASNAAGWQWVAGSGADASPYFRIFNPVLQGEKFDPDGAYVRRWVPELARIPNKFIHAPWLAPDSVLAAGGVQLGKHYPKPIVEHKAARTRALEAYAAMRS